MGEGSNLNGAHYVFKETRSVMSMTPIAPNTFQ